MRQSFAVVAGIEERCEMKKRLDTSESLNFLIFHHVAADHEFAAETELVVVCEVGVRPGYSVI